MPPFRSEAGVRWKCAFSARAGLYATRRWLELLMSACDLVEWDGPGVIQITLGKIYLKYAGVCVCVGVGGGGFILAP